VLVVLLVVTDVVVVEVTVVVTLRVVVVVDVVVEVELVVVEGIVDVEVDVVEVDVVVLVVVDVVGSPPHAPGPPVTPMSLRALSRDGGKQASSNFMSGLPMSMQGEPSTIFRSSVVQPVPAKTGLMLMLPVPVKPPCTSE